MKNSVLWGFPHLEDLSGFTLLEADQSGKLAQSANQTPNGEYIITDARRKNGPIYIHPISVSNYNVYEMVVEANTHICDCSSVMFGCSALY